MFLKLHEWKNVCLINIKFVFKKFEILKGNISCGKIGLGWQLFSYSLKNFLSVWILIRFLPYYFCQIYNVKQNMWCKDLVCKTCWKFVKKYQNLDTRLKNEKHVWRLFTTCLHCHLFDIFHKWLHSNSYFNFVIKSNPLMRNVKTQNSSGFNRILDIFFSILIKFQIFFWYTFIYRRDHFYAQVSQDCLISIQNTVHALDNFYS